jgi:Rrf2 family protein
MKFSAQEEYGLRCMLQFARTAQGEKAVACGDRSLTIGEIAEIEGITPQYAGKLIRILRMGGLLESVRGRHGGYRLARPIEEISVGEVLAVLGGRVFHPDYCTRYSGERKFCVHTVDCTIRSLWVSLQELVDRVLSRVNLTDLIGSEKGMSEWLSPLTAEAEALFPMLPMSAGRPAGGESMKDDPAKLAGSKEGERAQATKG